METHACSLPSIWTVLQVKYRVLKKTKVSDIKVVNSMAEHERQTQQYAFTPGQKRLHLSVDQPKHQSSREREREHDMKDVHFERCTLWTLFRKTHGLGQTKQ